MVALRKKAKAIKKAAKKKNTYGKSASRKAAKKAVSTKTASSSGAVAAPAERQRALESVNDRPLCVVGIGTSGGGLEAMEEFLSTMPAHTGVAFVLVPHLDPSHASIMADLLRKYTDMEVLQADDRMEVKCDRLYVIPPGKDMAIMNGSLQLLEPHTVRGMRHPIDFFFRSLAKDQRERAVCVVLSGAGTDGTLGLKEIKGEGGMVMVQEPGSAKYDGMPRSALETGLADYVLPAGRMAKQLLSYVKHPYIVAAEKRDSLMRKISENLEKVLLLIRNQTGHDFSYYKENTITRRIERRMNVNQITEVPDYINYLQRNPVEVELLFKELLIGVTNFFRDPEAFDALKKKALPAVFKARPPNATLRVWVPGCSTGEEAYSLAIILREYMDRMRQSVNIQIFSTDIDTEAIERARAGVYPDSIAGDVSPERLKKFFMKNSPNTFQIKKEIREMVVFAAQDLIKDPPFTRLDIVSCRNLLIYLSSRIQKKLLPMFHFVLNPEGILFLGSSETIGDSMDLFTQVDKKWKIFRRRKTPHARPERLEFPTLHPIKDITEAQRTGIAARREEPVGIGEVARRLLMEDYAPPCVVINEKNNILYIYGKTGKYLEPAPGEARLNILEMAREGLEYELGRLIRKAVAQRKPVAGEGLAVRYNGSFITVDVEVKPLLKPEQLKGLYMVVFREAPRRVAAGRTAKPASKGEARRADQLEKELAATKEYLQHAIEEQETTNEELQSTNEELQASNEELQSTNEELETSKEEIQSVNEELVTVNSELQNKLEELSRANNDLNNLLSSTDIAVIFLDNDMCVKRFTPAATKLVNLIQSDIGRPIEQITNMIQDGNLVDDVRQVLKSLVFREREVQTRKGQWFLMRIMPYRTTENVIDGSVITFTDITGQKTALDLAREATEKYRSIFQEARDGIVLMEAETGRIVECNPEFERQTGRKLEDLKKMKIWEIRPPGKVEAARRKFFEIRQKGVGGSRQLEFQKPDGALVPVEFESKVISIRDSQFVQSITHWMQRGESSNRDRRKSRSGK
jgi:two-component system CheB/CheR fusion protein